MVYFIKRGEFINEFTIATKDGYTWKSESIGCTAIFSTREEAHDDYCRYLAWLETDEDL